ncbi:MULTISPECIES: bifunctional 4-hydroxy-2-oxoglutarate aldolase/2-dehydro-3-deoxy-phosphogluconate aldolase [Halomonas]|uniref:2-dehydro-3-deoxy-phosphogluconate aldolase n=3 Tax=Halomonas TaxID=2745 RepID=A0AAU7KKB4_9GAMM|nr:MULTISPECIES: bifunctional 4-hydroxy-2-oxoglutarate aldolase/2-dehydro-3-deoxy-phosphogluconate aldolase [Halomonas]MBR9769962.1 bifunctional 4-hydroxy-2-oxoglutarate aldolase/2-dehydro-3-deoxy-phosphogluconate aldolase [Gammaproteobacteria bacterium]KJZ18078.1 keto-deoxy-phosphogluconate aldolase [Halomonas sp. S2151]MAR72851.1 keto-deoxy-phosphogluconate aldolase [Halomonas sp.]MAY69845.1 keto-deoxy-phosphogluconate aldolase [Halomonas sp.]MBR9878377.1 bifunctional 4-hydroxy-2-oxoglutarat|tara:strand:+ start:1190 stop:1852 length:663 start_codon:yes stop_codon:yes gene_type:complete
MTIEKQLPSTRTTELDSICLKAEVIPVIVIDRIEDAVPMGRALVEGGLSVLEVTLRTDCAIEAIARLKKELPQASIAAGTVLTPAQYRQVEQAGADFVVTPGATEALYRYGVESPVPMLPGVATISELMTGWQYGYRRFKFFPAEASGGVKALKAFAGPIGEARFCPTGGINLGNASEYLALPNVMCVGGSWLTPKSLVDAGDWDAIRALAKEAADRFHH